ncbi:MAG: trypsin-like peptidase domain-containing protein [Planctomycetia bacterium]|nr:trypsin-like peptidase domain-containing protein [Planctomycetia bacterium]
MVPMTLVVASVLGMGGDLEGVVLDFTSRNCPPCREMSPIVSRLERHGYPIRKVDCESNRDLVNRFNIQKIPAFVLVVDGAEKARLNGVVTEQELIQFCARIPRPADSGDSLGEPSDLPRRPAARRESDAQVPTAPPAKQPPTEKSGITWPFGSRKKDEPAREAPAGAVPRGKAEDRPAIAVPVQGNPLAASVRIRVRDSKGDSYGSGTIIDSRVGQTTIVTCGHIFRHWDKQTVIEVDWFDKGHEQMWVGRKLFHDLKADVGLIAINCDSPLPICRVAPSGTKLLKGTPVVAVGCSGGEKPTVQHVKITELNRYKGAANIEVGSMPVEGRSGGGLFTKDGNVIGVCSGAEGHYKEGIFIGLKTLHDLLDHCRLSRLYGSDGPGESIELPGQSAIASVNLGETDEEEGDEPDENVKVADVSSPKRIGASTASRTTPARRPVERASADANAALGEALEQAGEAEVVCIIRPVNQPGAASRVVILNRASRRFVEYLADELEERPEILETSLSAPDATPRAKKPAASRKANRPATLDATEAEPQEAGPRAYRRHRVQ